MMVFVESLPLSLVAIVNVAALQVPHVLEPDVGVKMILPVPACTYSEKVSTKLVVLMTLTLL